MGKLNHDGKPYNWGGKRRRVRMQCKKNRIDRDRGAVGISSINTSCNRLRVGDQLEDTSLA